MVAESIVFAVQIQRGLLSAWHFSMRQALFPYNGPCHTLRYTLVTFYSHHHHGSQ